jgi:hypothetical protein
MTGNRITPPPGSLLRAGIAAPQALTVTAEVRSDAGIRFDPKDALPFLNLATATRFGAFVVWRVDLSWPDAQRVQLWLPAAPAGGIAPSREEALKDLIETLVAPDPSGPDSPFANYLGTFLTSDLSHASYTVLIGLKRPVPRDAYQQAWINALNGTSGAAWFGELLEFLRLMLAQPTSREEFIQMARNVGDLKATTGPVPPIQNAAYPVINLLIP